MFWGAKVLSCPGFLSKKNIFDIENNVVEGKTTWKHQNNYGKVMLVECLNQAKRMLGRGIMKYFMDRLPGVLVQIANYAPRDHKATSFLGGSRLFRAPDGLPKSPGTDGTTFLKKSRRWRT